jgi:hypothetical protein
MKKIAAALAAAVFLAMLCACSFLTSFSDSGGDTDYGSLSVDSSSLSLSIGEMGIVNLKVGNSQSSAPVSWEYDKSVVSASRSDQWGIVLKGVSAGSTPVRARCGSSTAVCIVTVGSSVYSADIENPYVYCSQDFVFASPGETVKFTAGVFGGTSDVNSYTFTCDKSSVASISYEGNVCWVTGVAAGQALVTVSSTASQYPASVLVSVSADSASALPYITTSSNVVSVDMSSAQPSAEFSVSLMNAGVYDKNFTWSAVSSAEQGAAAVEDSPFTVICAGGTFRVSAVRAGQAYIAVSHPLCSYPLYVLVRCGANPSTDYISLSSDMVTLTSDTGSAQVTASVSGSGYGYGDEFEWKFSDGASEYLSWSFSGSSSGNTSGGDTVYLEPRKNGSAKVTVSYPGTSLSPRSFIVVCRNLASSASDAKTYISTSSNYISTYAGADDISLSVILNNTSKGREKQLEWHISNTAADGSASDVISYVSGDGVSFSTSTVSRSADSVYMSCTATGTAVIRPVRAGRAVITLSHPDAMYSTEVIVSVAASKPASSPAAPLLSCSGSIVRLCSASGSAYGGSCELSALLGGSASGEAAQTSWKASDGAPFTLSAASGQSTVVSYTGSGSGRGSITLSNPQAGNTVTVPVIYAADDASVEAVKSVWISGTASYTVEAGCSCMLSVDTSGLSDTDLISWTVDSGLGSAVSFEQKDRTSALVTGLSSGASIIHVSCAASGDDLYFTVSVLAAGAVSQNIPCYLTTGENVVYFSSAGDSSSVSVTPVNIRSSLWSQTSWDCSDSSAFRITDNGSTASVEALKNDCEAVLSVSHPCSSNTLRINLRCGSRYAYKNTDVPYISISEKTVALESGETNHVLEAVLAHTESSSVSREGLSFASSDPSVATVSYTEGTGTCLVSASGSGTAVITVSCALAQYPAEIPVVVNPPADYSKLPYITSALNVITVAEGDFQTVSASLVNSSAAQDSDWKWTSEDPGIASPVVSSGSTVMISGSSPGTTRIVCSCTKCPYTLRFICIVLASSSAGSSCYIQTSTNVLTVASGADARITASMAGGSESDILYFSWSSDSPYVRLTPGTGSCSVKGISEGTAKITVSNINHPDAYTRTVLVIVTAPAAQGSSIILSDSSVTFDPDDGAVSRTVTASLSGGSETDAEDFVWWCDSDSIVSLDPLVNGRVSGAECVVTSRAVTGTSYIHVMHPKAAQHRDIAVIVSRYSEFSFGISSYAAEESKVSFISMQVPAGDSDKYISYSSDNPSVCAATGQGGVCMLEGVSQGTAVITALLHSSVEKKSSVESKAQLAVSVAKSASSSRAVVFAGGSMAFVNTGSDLYVSASVTGDNLGDGASSSISWSLGSAGGLVLNNPGSSELPVKGDAVRITCPSSCPAGSYVLTASYSDSYGTASSDMLVTVTEPVEIGISLDASDIVLYAGDSSAEITATLKNSTSSADYEGIRWTATTQGGAKIVRITTKGKVCQVTPVAEGVSTVRALASNGAYADCFVIVKSAASIKLGATAVHIMPGFSETVSCTVYPEGAPVTWYTLSSIMGSSSSPESTASYFSYEYNAASSSVVITGLKNAGGLAGTLNGTLMSASSSSSSGKAQLSVYVEYDTDLTLEGPSDGNWLHLRDGVQNGYETSFGYTCFPDIMNVEVSVDTDKVTVGSVTGASVRRDSITEKSGKITLDAHRECACVKVTVTARLPVEGSITKALSEQYAVTQVKYYTVHYDPADYRVSASWTLPAGSFSRYHDDGSSSYLELGDGEEIAFTLRLANPLAAASDAKVTWMPGAEGSAEFPNDNRLKENGGLITLSEEQTASDGSVVYRLKHGFDYYTMGPKSSSVTETEAESDPAKQFRPDDAMYCIDKDLWFDVSKSGGDSVYSYSAANPQYGLSWCNFVDAEFWSGGHRADSLGAAFCSTERLGYNNLYDDMGRYSGKDEQSSFDFRNWQWNYTYTEWQSFLCRELGGSSGNLSGRAVCVESYDYNYNDEYGNSCTGSEPYDFGIVFGGPDDGCSGNIPNGRVRWDQPLHDGNTILSYDNNTVKVRYASVKPYFMTVSEFRRNPNYRIPSCLLDAGSMKPHTIEKNKNSYGHEPLKIGLNAALDSWKKGGNEGTGPASDVIHQAATLAVSVDPAPVGYLYGSISYEFKGYDGLNKSAGNGGAVPVTIVIRKCKSYLGGSGYRETEVYGLKRWVSD